MKIINKIVHSIKEPEDHYIYWFDEKSKEIKYYSSTEGWTPIVPVEDYLTKIKEDILYIKDDIRISKDEMVLKLDSINNSILELAENASNAILAIEEELDTTVRKIESILYDELVHKVENGELIPGQFYRITDFVTTTKESSYYTSAEHQFDIIVKALDAYTLSEDAEAIHHEDDAYFSDSKLSAWTLKYNIYNDTNKFNWARREVYTVSGNTIYNFEKAYDITTTINTTSGPVTIVGYIKGSYGGTEYILPKDNIYAGGGLYYYKYSIESVWNTSGSSITYTPNGKGVIYYMRDEFGNEAPYDFKNIQVRPTFIRDSFANSSVADKLDYIEQANITSNGFNSAVEANIIWTETDFYYTFTNGNNEDASKSGLCHDNIIEPYYGTDDTYDLPKIVISSSNGQIHGNKFLQCSHNIYAKGEQFKHNIFDENCDNVIIEGSNNYSFYDNHITSALNVILGHGNMWDNRLFSLNNSILYSGSHVKNNHFLGIALNFKFLVASLQNIHVFGEVSNLIVMPTQAQAQAGEMGYLLSCAFHPWTNNIQITGFKWLEKAIFQGSANLHLQAPDYTNNYGNIMVYPGNYTDVGMITDIPLSNGASCEIKRSNSTSLTV